MASIPIHDRDGNQVGTYEVDPAEFAKWINTDLLHQAVVMVQANDRQGSHQTRSRGMVKGSTRKLFRQKGTGNARAGSRRSGLRRGGGHIFALRTRDYSKSMNRKARQTATRMAIASKIRDEQLVLVDKLAFEAPQTSAMAKLLKNIGCAGQRLLLGTNGYDQNSYKSGRNIPGVTIRPVAEFNAHDILLARRIVLTPDAFDTLRNAAAGNPASPATPSSEPATVGEAS